MTNETRTRRWISVEFVLSPIFQLQKHTFLNLDNFFPERIPCNSDLSFQSINFGFLGAQERKENFSQLPKL